MWIPKWYLEAQARRIDRLERKTRRLELICLEDAKSKIASLRDEEAGTITKDGCLSIEEIVARTFSSLEGDERIISQIESWRGGSDVEIRTIKIDFEESVLEINGKQIVDRPVSVILPGPDGWPLIKLFNAHLATGNPEECDKIKVDYKKAFNSKL